MVSFDLTAVMCLVVNYLTVKNKPSNQAQSLINQGSSVVLYLDMRGVGLSF